MLKSKCKEVVKFVVSRFIYAFTLQHFAEINDLFALGDDDLACKAKDGGVGGVLASLMGHLKGAAMVLNHSL